jgi:hypothetical protein
VFRSVTAATLAGALALSSCPLAPPRTLVVRGAALNLPAVEFDLPFTLDAISGILPKDTSVVMYNPPDTDVQHLLAGMKLDLPEQGIPGMDDLGEGMDNQKLSYGFPIPNLSFDNKEKKIANLPGGVSLYVSVPPKSVVKEGYLTIKTVGSIPGFNPAAAGVQVGLKTDHDDDWSYQVLEFWKEEPTGCWLFKFKLAEDGTEAIIYGNSMFYISGLPGELIANNDLKVSLSANISELSSVTLNPSNPVLTEIDLMHFGSISNSISGELADYIYSVKFYSIGIKFHLNRRVDGLKIQFINSSLGISAEGTSSLDDDYLIVTADDVSLEIVEFNPPSHNQLLTKLTATFKLPSTTVTLENVTPDTTVLVEAETEFPPDFRIKQAVVNPNNMPGLNLGTKIPEAGEAAIDMADFLGDIDKILPVENLSFSPDIFLYFEELPQGVSKIKLTAETGDGPVVKKLLKDADGQGFAALDPGAQPAPVLSGTEFSGPLPQPSLSMDSGALIDLLHEKPGDLRMAFDVKLSDPTTITFSETAADNTLSLGAYVLLDLPLEFKIKAEASSPDYAAIKLVSPDEGGEDLFNRRSAADAIQGPEEMALTFEYRNTLGIEADIILTSTGFDGEENFRKVLPLRSSGSGTFSLNLKRSELRYPFRPGFELLIPTTIQEGPDRYAVLKIVPGGSFQISRLRVDHLSFDLTGH